MRGRNYSYSPSPSRLYRRRYRSPMPRGYYGSGTEPPTSLLVRNLRRDCRPEDLRRPFGQFGPIKDIYLPRDYYTGEPRGFGFVQYVDPADAADAKYEMDGYALHGRELTVVFAEENRKRPSEMRAKQRSRDRCYDRRYSRSPRYGRSYSRSPEYYSRSRRYCSRSISPHERHRRELSYGRERSYSRSPYRSPNGSRSRSQTPYRRRSFSLSRSVSPEYIKHRE